MSTATLDRPVDVLGDLSAQAEKANVRRQAKLRAAYERGLLASVLGRPLSDGALAEFHESRAASAITETEVREDERLLKVWRDSFAPMQDVRAMQRRIEELRAEERDIRERRLPAIRKEMVELRYSIEFAVRQATVRKAFDLRQRFTSLDFDKMAAEMTPGDAVSKSPAGKPAASAVLATMLSH